MTRIVLLVLPYLTALLVGLLSGSLLTFSVLHHRLPTGSGEMINWLLGWSP